MKLQKLTVGLQQKVGQPNFGSTGASCVVEVVLDEYEAVDSDAIEHRIHQAFARCRKSIDDELRSHGTAIEAASSLQTPAAPRTSSQSRGHRPATDKQIRAIRTIAGKQGIELASELQARFHVASPEQLSIGQASTLIDAMKESGAPA